MFASIRELADLEVSRGNLGISTEKALAGLCWSVDQLKVCPPEEHFINVLKALTWGFVALMFLEEPKLEEPPVVDAKNVN